MVENVAACSCVLPRGVSPPPQEEEAASKCHRGSNSPMGAALVEEETKVHIEAPGDTINED